MMKKIFFGCLAVVAMTACSNEETLMEQNPANAIKFAVTTERNSRAADIYCGNNMHTQFTVDAVVPQDGTTKAYITGDLIQKEGEKWVDQSGTRYWPDGNVTFFGHVNADEREGGANKFDFNNRSVNFTVNGDVAAQKDLMYATKTQAKTQNQQVTLNFRHALSQVVFYAKNTNKNLYVEIKGVSVGNVSSKGTYVLPANDTDGGINHGATTEDEGLVRGTWTPTAFDALTNKFDVALSAKVPVVYNEGAQNLTDHTVNDDNGHADGAKNFGNAMLLLPQTTEAFDVENFQTSEGTYFLVKCKIWNVADAAKGFDATSDVLLWGGEGEEGFKNALVPVAFAWEQGKKYVYTLVFGNGNGGFDPDPENPKPVLLPISYEASVDEFVPVIVTPDVDMDTENGK